VPKITIRSNDGSRAVLHTLSGDTLWGADLSGLDLSGAAMYAIEVTGFEQTGNRSADLRRSMTDVSGANLSHSDLAGAVFSDEEIVAADFSGANLSRAVFVRASLINVNLRGANLAGARFKNTSFSNCGSLHFAQGLDEIEHAGPTALDALTLRASVPRLPISFLLGVGFSEREVTAIRKLYGAKIDFASCFISYARPDADLAEYLRRRLMKVGITCWQDVHDMRGGDAWRGQIYKAIEEHDKLVLICSRQSLTRPAVVEEIIEAIDRERDSGVQRLFPIRLDDFVFSNELDRIARDKVSKGQWRENWVTQLRSYHIPDFAGWKAPRRVRVEFAKLLEVLTKTNLRGNSRRQSKARRAPNGP
jgi:hypothetical protein